MQAQFERHLRETGLISQGQRVLVGYSGGADSTCLLDLLVKAGVDVVAAHLHHGQRAEADLEQKLCQAFAEDLDVPFVTGRADVPRMALDLGMGLEEAGREARYAFFRQAAFGAQCHLTATAHTRTDSVESMVLHLCRGTGLTGLSGIPERRGEIIRPLLPFSREQTRAYCEAHGLWFHDDPANEDLNFSRARVRHRILPEMQAMNPSVEAALARLTTIVGEEDRFLNGMAAAALEQSEVDFDGSLRFLSLDSEIRFRRDSLTSLPPVLFKRSIRLVAEALGAQLDFDQTHLITRGVSATDRGSVTAEGGDVAITWSPELIEARRLYPDSPFRYPLTVPGETESEDFGWKFTVYPLDESRWKPARASMAVELNPRGFKGSLYFRTMEAGDQIQPLGFDGRRKLADLLSEAHLSETARRRLPIVCDMIGPIWAPGVVMAERVRPEPGKPGLAIRFEAISPEENSA